ACSSGAGSELREAPNVAVSMAATLGLGDEGNLFNIEALNEMNLSPDMKEPIARAEQLLRRLGDESEQLLQAHRGALDAITQALLERESIDGDELVALVSPHRLAAHVPHLPQVA